MSPLLLSLEIAGLALINILVIGLLLVYLMKRYNFIGKALLDAIFMLPLVLPPVVVGFVLLMIFSPANWFGAWLDTYGLTVVFTKAGAVIAASVVAFPLFYQTARSALESVNTDIEDVARTLGASEWRIFLTITIPLAWKGLVTGGILAFSRALGEFGATILLAGNIPGVTRTMPLAIYSLVEYGDYDGAWFLVAYICILTLSLLCFVHLLTHKKIGIRL